LEPVQVGLDGRLLVGRGDGGGRRDQRQGGDDSTHRRSPSSRWSGDYLSLSLSLSDFASAFLRLRTRVWFGPFSPSLVNAVGRSFFKPPPRILSVSSSSNW